MSKKLYANLLASLVLASLVLSACAGTAPTQGSALPADLVAVNAIGYGDILVSESEFEHVAMQSNMFVPGITAPAGYLVARAFDAMTKVESGYLVATAPAMSAADALLLIASLAIGNTVQNVTEGRNLVLQVQNPDGTIGYWEVNQTGQIVNQVTAYNITASDVQEAVEGNTDVNANLRDQCQEQGTGCQATPGPQKTAVVFGDIGDSSLVAILQLWGIQGTLYENASSLLADTRNFDVVIIRAGDDAWRLDYFAQIKARWPMAKIIVMSGGSYESKAKELGADGYHQSETGPETMKALLQSLGLMP